MTPRLEVLFAPAEFAMLKERDLSRTVCVVFDVLRATSTMVTALANGAKAILPVADIQAALAVRARCPEVLLAGEREGLRIDAAQTGGTEFDLGNSPREFTREAVSGKTIVMTTTNGTRALRACATAQRVLLGSFLNLGAVGAWLGRQPSAELLLVCGGTLEQAAYEDALGAGALCDRVWPEYAAGEAADSAVMARELYRVAESDLGLAVERSRNGRRLLAIPELRGDVAACARRDVFGFVAGLERDGTVRRLSEGPAFT
jgi:2-phosphosulfolactate phosphatase